MTDGMDALAQALFNKPSLQACSLQQVEYLAHQYPYFTTAQLLLLHKAERHTEAYSAQLQRAALHAAHPLQLHYWIQPAAFETALPETQLFQKPIPAKQTDKSTPAIEPEIGPGEALKIEPAEAPGETTPIPAGATESFVEKRGVEELEIEETPATETPGPSEYQDVTKTEEAIVERAEPTAAAIATEPSTTLQPEPPTETVAIAAPDTNGQTGAGPITFEPYHTVDYFASQGIKLSQQEVANDTLGRQLKSFTQWLKTLKRLPEATAAQPVDQAVERKVEHLAAHSLDTPDVVTESMAEVWLKQGNMDKAADVYNKLSLRYPSKSAYFATKIESLKKS